MLSLHTARERRAPHGKPRIGLAIAGGGPIGSMYELGALRALDEAIEGLDLNRMDCYVGVSSGAFLAAGLANRMRTEEICRIFITGDSYDAVFRPSDFMRPAVAEYMRRAAALPRIARKWWGDMQHAPWGTGWSNFIMRFGGLVPTGLFDNAQVEHFLRDVLTRRGRTNDFRKLDVPLYVIAVDLDNGEAVRFGSEQWRDVPISKAVQASAALPGLYPPVQIRGRSFVDGALRRTMHASVVLEQDIDLLIGVNPLVPFNAQSEDQGLEAGAGHSGRLARGGLPAVLSQTFRTLLQSRMQVGLAKYATQYPNIDQLIFEPNARDGEMFFTNAFSFSARARIAQIGYRNTLADLRRRAEILRPMLAAHGLALREGVVNQPRRSIFDGLPPASRDSDATARLRRALDELEQRATSGMV
ncbi:lectin subunit beta [Lysobacter daejeonensis GH1-9]|uniref:Lectin subunit beta n=1 Tax=Lysobacter daejeonensis GH1-9 TaxID=1385517 RepID=A0A0A0EVZ4_9GAMM|nr:patatin-like phospholipase family protein [Lysobacter daejeonensis]KGM54350.1 lectin subunit beta [Lysobacter daejeonensis GH1-9]